uniref:C2orf72-like C-terminal domain-containing protein n=1 Tax=Geospiza parvula TaxID=87175 RepID=A0A8C3MGF1_GEOPR
MNFINSSLARRPACARELRALVERAGGRRAVLLVAEVAEGAPAAPALVAFARDLLGDEAPRAACPGPGCRARRSPGAGGRALGARLLLVLCGGGAARDRGARTRLREVVRDVRGRLPAGPPPAVVGVLLPGGDGEDAAVLDAALRRHFPAPGTVQAARYSPGSPGDCRAAACRALRAALQRPPMLFFILSCIFWEEGFSIQVCLDLSLLPADDLQDPEEEVALASLSPNGNCEEAAGGTGT